MNKVLLLTYLTLVFSSCIVSKKKYDDLVSQKVKTEAALTDQTAKLDSVKLDLASLTGYLTQLKEDTAAIGQEKRIKTSQLAELELEHEKLNSSYKNLIASNGKQNRDLVQQQEQVLMIQQNLEKTRRENDSLNNNLLDREKKVRELERVLATKDKAVLDLKNKVSGALLNFKENDISVKVKNGKVYISLAEQLLFGSGSIDVDAKGITALQQVAKVVKDQKDINILVEGHTDNVPISKKSQYMQDNWDLSVMRATSITRILTKAGVSPKQITAAGHGEYAPVSFNESAASKQKNRRTEIVITPNLDELFRILEN